MFGWSRWARQQWALRGSGRCDYWPGASRRPAGSSSQPAPAKMAATAGGHSTTHNFPGPGLDLLCSPNCQLGNLTWNGVLSILSTLLHFSSASLPGTMADGPRMSPSPTQPRAAALRLCKKQDPQKMGIVALFVLYIGPRPARSDGHMSPANSHGLLPHPSPSTCVPQARPNPPLVSRVVLPTRHHKPRGRPWSGRALDGRRAGRGRDIPKEEPTLRGRPLPLHSLSRQSPAEVLSGRPCAVREQAAR